MDELSLVETTYKKVLSVFGRRKTSAISPATPGTPSIIAYRGTKPVGFLVYSVYTRGGKARRHPSEYRSPGEKGFIWDIWVDPQYRTGEVARALVEEVELQATSFGLHGPREEIVHYWTRRHARGRPVEDTHKELTGG